MEVVRSIMEGTGNMWGSHVEARAGSVESKSRDMFNLLLLYSTRFLYISSSNR